jgi:hypothetical protein
VVALLVLVVVVVVVLLAALLFFKRFSRWRCKSSWFESTGLHAHWLL